jgi:D-beta-D-heptose 7-phosphate kinase/D-beta-D-heptose 1-phosphate adenosyltransferase
VKTPDPLPERTPPDWPRLVAALCGRRLLVVGDVMLDEYLAGDARRVCPEAPVPVVEAARRWSVPGGAANAAANAAALGGRVTLGGATGDDRAAGELAEAVRTAGVDPAGLVADPSRPTTAKLRVLARGQQVIRVDTESAAPLVGEPAGKLAAWAQRSVATAEAVLLSDYGKGVAGTELAGRVIAAATRAGRPVVVDPKGRDASRYRGATVVKPNLSELAELTGRPAESRDEVLAAGTLLAEELPGTVVLVTRGPEGMALFRSGGEPALLPAAPRRRVFDVTGAGDTAAAALALALAAGLTVELAARLANAAGGVSVGKVGTAVVTPAELAEALLEDAPPFGPAELRSIPKAQALAG